MKNVQYEIFDLPEIAIIGTSAIIETELDGIVGMNSGIFNNPFIGWGRYRKKELRQYRTKIVPQMRCQIFRQIVQKFRRHTDVCRGIFVQDDGKYASRCGAKPQGGLCAVLP